MAIITRRYVFRGPPDSALAKFVGSGAIKNVVFPYTITDVDVDDATPGAVDGLDEYMARLGFDFDPTATPNTLKVGDGQPGNKEIEFSGNFKTNLRSNPTADRIITLPDASGSVAIESGPGSYVKQPVDVSLGPVVFPLPDITAGSSVQYVYDQLQAANAGPNLLTIAPDASDSIAGAPVSLVIDMPAGGVTLVPDLTTNAWFILGGQGYTAS